MNRNIYNYEDDLLNQFLEFCIDKNKFIYSLNDFRMIDPKFIESVHPTMLFELFPESLFDIHNNIIQISIKVS